MKLLISSHNCITFRIGLISIFILFSFGCSSLQTYELSDNYDKSKYRTIGLLVNRVGNIHEGVLAPITIETNYATRVPRRELSSGQLYMKEHEDVLIESQQRLSESFPNYPCIRYYASARCILFYKNISPDIYRTIANLMQNRGYKVIDVRQKAKAWNTPLSEVTIGDISNRIANDVDALLVFHYLDVERDGIFSDLWYTLSMFNVASKKRILFAKSTYGRGIVGALYSDRSIPPGKIEVIEKDRYVGEQATYGGGKTKFYATDLRLHLSEEELVDYHMKYLRHGFSTPEYRVEGLETILP